MYICKRANERRRTLTKGHPLLEFFRKSQIAATRNVATCRDGVGNSYVEAANVCERCGLGWNSVRPPYVRDGVPHIVVALFGFRASPHVVHHHLEAARRVVSIQAVW